MAGDLLKRAQTEGTPLIDGDEATFVWHGKKPPHLIGDFTNWEDGEPVRLVRVAQQMWAAKLNVPQDAYLEYIFMQDDARLTDPFNPRTIPNGMGKINNYFFMPEGLPTPLSRRETGVARGTVTTHRIDTDDRAAGRLRKVYLYQPPVHEPCPLIVVWDGQDYLRRARLPYIIDNLIAQGRIQPLALAMVANGGQARLLEYGCNDITLTFLIEYVLPLASQCLNLIDITRSPGSFAVLGASMGGLMALYTGLRLPHIFGKVLSQSGAFSIEDYDTVVYDLIQMGEPKPLQIWMDVGKFEELLETNRRMSQALQAAGYPVIYREYNAGHNYPAWRDDLWRGIEALFGI
ncbi:MAG: esterase family protein [Chloroflexota bacterium]|nr:MAG: esterase family protein [Chloroflexota bacterium]